MNVADMTEGQLKLHCMSVLTRHGVDIRQAGAIAGRASPEALQFHLTDYEQAAAKEDWTRAEDALIALARNRADD